LSEENGVKARLNGSNNPSVLLSRTTANQNTRNALRSLVEHDMLAEFWTSFACTPKPRWKTLLPPSLRKQVARRVISEAPADKIKSVPWREAVRHGARGTPLESLLCSGERPFSVFGMNQGLDSAVARRIRELKPDMVYANEGAALLTFREAKNQGITTVVEQSSSYWKWRRDLLRDEAERNPEFASLLPGLMDPAGFLERKQEELRLADYVFVPSDHVLRTLEGVVPTSKIRVVSYGAPQVRPREQFNLNPLRPLRVLFVGNLGQNKGIGYLLEAIGILGSRVELTMVGRRVRPHPKVDEALSRWRWYETLPHSQVLDVMQQSDVLVLASLSEGCALVVLEALACGLPVIVTPNTGSLAFVRDGREGFVVPIRRPDAIAERLEILHRDRAMLAAMSQQAQVTAAERSWESYRTQWADAIRSLAWQ
jgi:starch synthase